MFRTTILLHAGAAPAVAMANSAAASTAPSVCLGCSHSVPRAPRVCFGGSCTQLNNEERLQKLLSSATPPINKRPSFSSCCSSCDGVRTCSASGGHEHHVTRLFLNHLLHKTTARRRFVEIGGYNGLVESNTLFMEHCLGWQGVLVEAEPELSKQLRHNRPGVLTLQAAACARNATHVEFVQKFGTAGYVPKSQAEADALRRQGKLVIVPCVHLGDALRKLDFATIDYFSLDVQGFELTVVQSIDWRAVRAAVLVVEERRVEGAKNKAVADVLHDQAGMVRAFTLCWQWGRVCDGYFVHPELVDVDGLSRAIGTYNFANEHMKGIGLGCDTSFREKGPRVAGQATTSDRDGIKTDNQVLAQTHAQRHALVKQRHFLNASLDWGLHATVPSELTTSWQRARAQAMPSGPARAQVAYEAKD